MNEIASSRTKIALLILLVFISLSCFYFLDSSNGEDVGDNTNNNAISNSYPIVNLTISKNPTVHPIDFPMESSNVNLNANNYLIFVGNGMNGRVLSDISLTYKENNMPLSNQLIYFSIGNEISSFVTDENGMIPNIHFIPPKSGYVKIFFNGSKYLYNNSIMDLVPVSRYFNYISSNPCCDEHDFKMLSHTFILPNQDSLNHNNDSKMYIGSNTSVNNSNNKNNAKYKSQIVFAETKLKKTGIPLIQLILSLMFVLGFLLGKNDY